MSYRRSRARCEFEEQLALALHELKPLYKYAHKHGGGSRLLAAYYIFAYSQFEVYIKSFVEDAVGAFNSSAPAIDKWPDLMLGYLLHKGENLAADYRRYSVDEDEGAISKKIAQTARKIAGWGAGAAGSIIIDSSHILEKKKYPSPKNMPQLFKRMGIDKIWVVIGKAGRINAEFILTSLNDLRTGIAHEGRVPPGFGLGDFKDRINQMQRFVAALDRGVAKHFCSGPLSRSDWNFAMS